MSTLEQEAVRNNQHKLCRHFSFSFFKNKENSMAMLWHSIYRILHTCKKAQHPIWDTEMSIHQADGTGDRWGRGWFWPVAPRLRWLLICGNWADPWKIATSHPKVCTLVMEHPEKQVPLLVTGLKENKSWPSALTRNDRFNKLCDFHPHGLHLKGSH